MWLFSLCLLALAYYARISLCLARGTESGQYKVQPIYSPMARKEPPLLTFTSPTSTDLFFFLEFFPANPPDTLIS
jgi:hypothetical protein